MNQFTEVELDAMRVLWQHGEMKPAEIIEHFPRPIKNPAMRSILSVLVRKGHVTRRKYGKAFFYTARTQPDSAFSAMLGKMLDTFCSGSTEALLLRLIRSEKLTEKQLLELKRIAGRQKQEPLKNRQSKS